METTIIFFQEYYLLGCLFFLLLSYFLPDSVKTEEVGPWR
jgi:hypothetical protein